MDGKFYSLQTTLLQIDMVPKHLPFLSESLLLGTPFLGFLVDPQNLPCGAPSAIPPQKVGLFEHEDASGLRSTFTFSGVSICLRVVGL